MSSGLLPLTPPAFGHLPGFAGEVQGLRYFESIV